MRRVLLTGPSGFIGRHAISHLFECGFEVHTVGVRALPRELRTTHHHIVDLFDRGAVERIVGAVEPSHLLHFAWFVTPGAFWSSPENLRWVQASIDLLKAFTERGGRRSVIAGTCAEYEWCDDGICREFETKIAPNTLYGACKAALHLLHGQYAKQTSTSAAWGRVFYLYGPYEPSSRFVPSVTRSLLRGDEAKCTHGRQVRDFMHVEDVARAFVMLLNSDLEGPINIASGIPVSIGDVATMIAKETKSPELLRLGAVPASESEPPTLVADVERLRSLGFSPRYSLAEGLRSAIEWWRQSSV
jgi:nucleoside-diphosphate-sugar epimerase